MSRDYLVGFTLSDHVTMFPNVDGCQKWHFLAWHRIVILFVNANRKYLKYYWICLNNLKEHESGH